MALEIEKRILLKRLPLPTAAFKEVHQINQYYGPTGRLRHVEIFKDGKKSPVEKFIRTNKKTLAKGVNEEIESEITKKDFYKELKKCTRHLHKTRYIKKVGKYKWEVDVFDFKMVIAEVEVNTRKELKTVPTPKFIQSEMIEDITGNKSFSNFNLADKWKLKN
jgi:CYTH domain-containing protein